MSFPWADLRSLVRLLSWLPLTTAVFALEVQGRLYFLGWRGARSAAWDFWMFPLDRTCMGSSKHRADSRHSLVLWDVSSVRFSARRNFMGVRACSRRDQALDVDELVDPAEDFSAPYLHARRVLLLILLFMLPSLTATSL